MSSQTPKPDVLFRSSGQFLLALLAGVLLCWSTVALIRVHGKPWEFTLRDAKTWSIDPGRNPYEALVNWRGIYTGDYQPIFEAAQGYAIDPDFVMYKPEQLGWGRASFVYTPITALVCAPVSRPGMELQQSADIVSVVNHLMWIAGGVMLFLVLIHGQGFSWKLLALFVLLYLGYYPFAKALQLTQASVWIYFFLVVAVFAFQRGWLTVAGIALGLGVAIKPHLIVAPVILFFTPGFPRRVLWSCFASVATCAVISLIYAGWENCWTYGTKTLPTLSAGYAYYPNQTLNGMLLRLFKHYDPESFNLVKPHGWIKWLGTLFFIGVSVFAARVCRRRPDTVTPLDNLYCLAVVLAAGVLASPVAWLHHFTALAIPFVIIVHYFRARPEQRSAAVEGALFLSLLLTGWFFDTRGIKTAPETLLSGWGFAGVILLVGAMAAMGRRNAGVAPVDWTRGGVWLKERLARAREWPSGPLFIVLLIFAAAAADLLLYGHQFGLHNHSIQIPYLKQRLDPSLYPGDLFMESMRDYFSWFWVGISALAAVMPMVPLFLTGHVLTLLALYAGIFMLARRAFPEAPWVPVVAVSTTVMVDSYFGAESLHWSYFTHTSAASALGVWSLVLATGGSWVAALALAGFMFNLHAMQSAYLLILYSIPALLEWRAKWKQFAAGGAAWLLCALPGIWWMIGSGSLGAPDDFAGLLRAFYPYHFFASSWHAHHWVGVLFTIGLIALVSRSLPRTESVRRLVGMAVSIVAFWMIAGPLSEWNPPAFLLKLHVFRMSSYLVWIAIVLGSGWLLLVAPGRVPERWRPAALLLALLFIAAIGTSGYHAWWRALPWLLLLWITLSGALFLAMRSRARFVALGVCIFFVIVSLFEQGAERAEFRDTNEWRQKQWRRTQVWALANTPPGALFLTPPDTQGFRVHSERSPVGEWIDGAAILWDKEFAEHWRAWYTSTGGTFERHYDLDIWDRLGRRWLQLPEAEIQRLAEESHADYIIMRRPYEYEVGWGYGHDWNRTPIYRNDGYIVYAVK